MISSRLAIIAALVTVPFWGRAVESSETSLAQLAGPAVYAPSDIAITLERTRCFGTCPVYKVSINGVGEVTYEGLEHVTRTGVERAAIDMKQVEELLNEFLRARFMEALDEYSRREFVRLQDGGYRRLYEITEDLPGAILTLRLGSRTKRVVLAHNYPLELGRLPDLIDIAAGTEQWTGQSRATPPTPPGVVN